MPDHEYFERIARNLRLTPYQLYMLEHNGDKYDFRHLVKRGDVLYVPYKCELSRDFLDGVKKILLGPRADLIGPDAVIIIDRRGIKLNMDGTYRK
ncbi:MAG: hypothetical protein FWF97_01560 [Alphaproteobacteria bacterium]|nr:hypothetical protein [Alphaproteobacteria bacterium]